MERAPLAVSGLVGVQIFTSELDFDKIGLTSQGGVDLARWALLAPLWFAPLLVLVYLSGSLPRLAWSRPQRYMTLWLLWALASVLWSVDPRQSLLQGAAVVALWVTAMWFTNLWGFASLARVFVVATTIFLLAGLARDVLIDGIGPGFDRAEGLAFNPTNLARVAVMLIIVAGWLLLRSGGRRVAWAWVAVPVGFGVLIVSGSRVAVLSLIVAVLYVLARHVGARAAVAGGAAVVVLLLAAVVWAGSPSEAIGRDENPQDLSSLNGRTTIWSVGRELVAERPMTGYGTASGEVLWAEAARDGDISWQAVNAHNLILEILLSHGLVGLALFCGGLYSYVRRFFGVEAGLDALFLAILMTGLTESLVNRPSSAVILLGALFAVASTESASVSSHTKQLAVVR